MPRTDPRADAKLQRWIDLLAVLLAHHFGITFERIRREVPGYASDPSKSQTANEAAIARMFERDKNDLRALGFPIDAKLSSDGEDLGYTIDPREVYLPYLSLASTTGRSKPRKVAKQGYRALPELTFEPDELDAVLRAATPASTLGDPLLDEQFASALRKLTFDLPVGLTRTGVDQVTGGGVPRASAEQLGPQLRTLGEALLRLKRVTFTYHSIGSDAVASRTVEPYGLFIQSAVWYLAGRDTAKDVLRNFRVGRISDVELNEHKPQSTDYEVPPKFRLSTHARSREAWEIGDGDADEMIVEFTGTSRAARAAAALGTPVAGSRQRSFQVRRVDSFARWLLSFAGDTKPVSPPVLSEAYGALVEETLAVYTGAVR